MSQCPTPKGYIRGTLSALVKINEGNVTPLARLQRPKGATHTRLIHCNPLIYKAFSVFPFGRFAVGRFGRAASGKRREAQRWVLGGMLRGIPRFLPPKKNHVVLYESMTYES
jgi:hypothetical protein